MHACIDHAHSTTVWSAHAPVMAVESGLVEMNCAVWGPSSVSEPSIWQWCIDVPRCWCRRQATDRPQTGLRQIQTQLATCLLFPVSLSVRVRLPWQLQRRLSLLCLLLRPTWRLLLLCAADKVWCQLMLLHQILQLPPPATAATCQACAARHTAWHLTTQLLVKSCHACKHLEQRVSQGERRQG